MPREVPLHFGAGAARQAKKTLRTVLSDATADYPRLFPVNPVSAAKIKIEKDSSSQYDPLTVEGLKSLVTAMPERYRIFVVLGSALGERRGEILGLRRSDFKFEFNDGEITGCEFTISRQVARTVGGSELDDNKRTKTPTSNRVQRLGAPFAKEVFTHLQRFTPPSGDSWLLSTSTGSRVSTRQLNRVFARATKAAGLPNYTPHDLRRAAITWLHEEGVPEALIAPTVGHKDLATTRSYIQTRSTSADVAADVMSGLLAEVYA
jgi:integrase